MDPIKIFLNSSTLNSTDGNFGVVSSVTNFKNEFDKVLDKNNQKVKKLEDLKNS